MLQLQRTTNSKLNGKDKGMRLSNQQISELNNILQEVLGVAPSKEDSQSIGLAIVRFVSVKELNITLIEKGEKDGIN